MKRYLNKALLTGLGLVTFASLLNACFGFFISVIAARTLSHSDFGIFSVMTITGGFLVIGLDLGINAILVNRIAVRPSTRLYGAVLKARFLFAGLISLLCIIVALFVALVHLQIKDNVLYWLLILCASAWWLTFSTEQAHAQGLKLFWLMAIIIFSANLTRLLSIVIFSPFSTSLHSFILSYFVPTILLGGSLIWIRRHYLRNKKFSLMLKVIMPVVGWASITVILAAALFRVDLWIVTIIAGTKEAGRFAASFQMASFVYILGGTLYSIFLPEIAKFNKEGRAHIFLRTYLKSVLPFMPIMFLVALLFAYLTPSIFGKRYAGIELTTFLLSVSFILSVLNGPFYLLQQARQRYHFLASVHLGQIFTLIVGCLALVPLLGIQGAAITDLIMRVISIIFFIRITLTNTTELSPPVSAAGKL